MTKSDPISKSMPGVLWALLFGNFVIGTGVMIVPGTLGVISQSLGVSIAVAGQLISAGALTTCIGAPLFASLVANWDRRRLLALCMLWYGALHLICVLVPDFASLFVVRVVAMMSPAIFTPQAAACVGLLVPNHQRGRAITFVFLGWAVASVVGMPLAAYIGGTIGWHSAFILVAALSLISAAWVWYAMPNSIRPPALSRATWLAILQSPALMTCVSVTSLFASGQFVLFAYLAPYYKETLNVSPFELSAVFMWFGVCGLLGNIWMSRNVDRLGASHMVWVGILGMLISFTIWPLGSSFLLACLATLPWALGCFATNSAQQARLVGLAPALAGGSVALNTSAMYAGQAVGAAMGGLLISDGHMNDLHWFGAAILLLALVASYLATKLTREKIAQSGN